MKRSHADTADSHLKEIKKLKNPYSRLLYVLLYVRCSAESAIVNLMVFLIYVVLANIKGKRLYDTKMI